MLPQHLLGQHFLKNPSLLVKLTELASLSGKDVVVEIGAGMGHLTEQLVRRARFVYTFELDSRLYKILVQKFSSTENLKIIRADFLKYTLEDIFKEYREKLKILANIPYKITTPILIKFINDIDYIKDCNILLQKEVAERITSMPGNKNYGSLTVLLQAYFSIKILKYINRGSFSPPPKVDSAFVKLIPFNEPLIGKEKTMIFSRFLRICFSMRRKTLHNILKSIKNENAPELLKRLKIPSDARPENLTVHNFVDLCNIVM